MKRIYFVVPLSTRFDQRRAIARKSDSVMVHVGLKPFRVCVCVFLFLVQVIYSRNV